MNDDIGLLSDQKKKHSAADTIDQLDDDRTASNTALKSDLPAPSHVVGIGASAGGLTALQNLFNRIPENTGACFVVVQHLSPNFNTLMDELLAKHSKMLVKLAEDGEHLLPDHVYLMRPNRNILVAEGKLFLNEIHRTGQPNLPIDEFFRSLAVDAQNRSVGIILSGTGSDGSQGVKALREAGGLVMTQQPTEAEFDGMPVSAIRTGYVDAIGDVDELARQLVSYIRHPLTASKNRVFREHLESNNDLLERIFVRLRVATAIDFSLYKPSTIARRIEHRMGINNIETLPAYAELLDRKPEEFALLKSDLLIGVTQFFRDPEAFHELIESVLPVIASSKSADTPVRVWMVGISSGEEAYSIAIAFSELLEQLKLSITIKIFASDADSGSIDYASAGVYPPFISNDVSEERLSKYFKMDEAGNYVVNNRLRNMIVFATHNVLEDPPFSNMDLVVCRNMLIYFQTEAQERTLALFNFSLRDAGYLWLGSSESLGGQSENFSELSSGAKIWRKTRSARIPIRHINADHLRKTNTKHASRTHGLTQRGTFDQKNIYHNVRDRLLDEYGPSGILLNPEHQAVHIFGDCKHYIERHSAGHVTTHIDSLIVPSLSVPVSTCLAKAANSESGSHRLNDVPMLHPDHPGKMINITARRVSDLGRSNEPHFLIIFSQMRETAVEPTRLHDTIDQETYKADTHTQERLRELDLQLNDSRQELRNAYAELDTTSEELQATNEELMAANEELQSTNEELQSVNEELYTVNTEYQEKIAELMELNTDLDNLLNSTGYGIIFLDSTLSIRRFTPLMARYINLLPGDVDRPIGDFKISLDYPDLLTDLNQVLSSGETIDRKTTMHSADDQLSISISPYISTDKTINGVVMTIREQ